MGNTIALKLHTQHGQEIICDSRSHILNYELSMMAWFGGCVARAVPTVDGILDWPSIEREYRPLGPHWAPTGLIEIENTHNFGGGTAYPLDRIDEIAARAAELGLPVHMDGARLFHAAIAQQVPAARLARNVSTVMFCLSKGLGAPVGSILAGATSDIARGRHLRKRLGGGMRQAGILAAAGIYALEHHIERLAEDHANARYLASELARLPGIRVDIDALPTNIVLFHLDPALPITAHELCERLAARGVRMSAFSPTLVRAVTHYDCPRAACESAIGEIQAIWKTL
jgi:threonine aldolase